jgi:cytochrome c oxidase subunit 3
MSTANTAASPQGHHHAHHFRDLEHEFQASKLGVWVFLATEILMFGGLFVGYIIYHSLYPEMFFEGSQYLDWRLGFLNTIVLLLSSFTMALSIWAAQNNKRSLSIANLWVTLACGFIFMCVKYMEYHHKFELGIFPGKFFNLHEGGHHASNLALYFSFYFCMTGLHGSHVLIGMGLITWCLIRNYRGDFGPQYYTPLEGVGLFWHLVDLIWIYLFPLLYLLK